MKRLTREQVQELINKTDADGGFGDLVYPFGIRLFAEALGLDAPAIRRITIVAETDAFPQVIVEHALATGREGIERLAQIVEGVHPDAVKHVDEPAPGPRPVSGPSILVKQP